jgi:hypothetical protein
MSPERVREVLKSLEAKGLMRQREDDLWEPTPLGRRLAKLARTEGHDPTNNLIEHMGVN